MKWNEPLKDAHFSTCQFYYLQMSNPAIFPSREVENYDWQAAGVRRTLGIYTDKHDIIDMNDLRIYLEDKPEEFVFPMKMDSAEDGAAKDGTAKELEGIRAIIENVMGASAREAKALDEFEAKLDAIKTMIGELAAAWEGEARASGKERDGEVKRI